MSEWFEPEGSWEPVDLDGDGRDDYRSAESGAGDLEAWDAGGATTYVLDADGDGDMEALGTDEDGDGTPEMTMEDRDGDGVLESLQTPWSGGGSAQGSVQDPFDQI
jgi:hypothetical protein